MDARAAFEAAEEYEFIDVREDWEWDLGHIEGAHHVPLDQLPNRIDELPQGKPLMMVCRTGSRSELAAMFLKNQGVEAHNLDGGMVEWHESDYPHVATDGSPGTVS